MRFFTLATTVSLASFAAALPQWTSANKDATATEVTHEYTTDAPEYEDGGYSGGYEQYTSTAPYHAVQTHKVKVGGLGPDGTPVLRYDPEYVWGNPGDIVEFDFLANNHTVTESSFETPCQGIEGGFRSGFRPNFANIPGKELFTVTIEDTKPHWVYCGQQLPRPHCNAGMVFAINPPAYGDRTFEKFQYAAMSAPTAAPSTPATSTYSAPTAKKTHQVIVGGLGADNLPMLRYNPEYVEAYPGDIINFDFRAANHTVTQSSFDTPCEGIDGGFRSGVRMNPQDIPGLTQFQVEVADENPVWVYCGVADHCRRGMVFAINPGYKFAEFKQNAINSPAPSTTSVAPPAATSTAAWDY